MSVARRRQNQSKAQISRLERWTSGLQERLERIQGKTILSTVTLASIERQWLIHKSLFSVSRIYDFFCELTLRVIRKYCRLKESQIH